jgi:hypothetical protein
VYPEGPDLGFPYIVMVRLVPHVLGARHVISRIGSNCTREGKQQQSRCDQ